MQTPKPSHILYTALRGRRLKHHVPHVRLFRADMFAILHPITDRVLCRFTSKVERCPGRQRTSSGDSALRSAAKLPSFLCFVSGPPWPLRCRSGPVSWESVRPKISKSPVRSSVSAFVLRQHSQSDASEYRRIILSSLAANDDLPRSRTWKLRLRRPTPYPLGQRALCRSPSGRGSRQSQNIDNFIVSKCGSAPAQPPNSPVRFAVDSKSPDAFVGLNWF